MTLAWHGRRRRSGHGQGPADLLRPGPAAAGLVTAATVAAGLLAGCAAPRSTPPGTARSQPAAAPTAHGRLPPDPPTAAALLRIAQVFNDNYDNGAFGAVWDRWDSRSQALISRAEYVRRHRLCAPATHLPAHVLTAARAGGDAWHVGYGMGGPQRFVDTWYYRNRRWVFDIILSNPDAARLYRMPFRQYTAAVGCDTH